ncbi:hypothetical protein JVY00_06520 [Tsukamurella tyrosinosolvens]|uniref:hypothetical protein n=1 Tax=Tsukamurella tyrosinosolvens TaxID=57704 RepID=UPI001AFB74B6|nr:hypothetical protein [Tsukamurella tyrosinosolvens]QRY85720.1 hypothetical protein JVY00_06520 [Tsukamurella tyrosinosolvens]
MEKPESVQRPSAVRRWRSAVAAVFAAGMIAAGGLVVLPSQALPVASALPCPDGSNICGPTAPTQDPGPTQGNGGNTTAPQAPNTTIPPNQDTGLPNPPANGNGSSQGTVQAMPTPDNVNPNSCIAGCPTQTAPAPTVTQTPPREPDAPTQERPTVTQTPSEPQRATTTTRPSSPATSTSKARTLEDRRVDEERVVYKSSDDHMGNIPFTCEDGYHYSWGNDAKFNGACWPDYDYNVVSVDFEGIRTAEAPIAVCSSGSSECKLEDTITLTTTRTWEQSSEIGGEVGFPKDAISASVSAKAAAKTGQEVKNEIQAKTSTAFDIAKIPPGKTAYGYAQYNLYKVVIQKYNTQTKTAENVVTYMQVPLRGIEVVYK